MRTKKEVAKVTLRLQFPDPSREEVLVKHSEVGHLRPVVSVALRFLVVEGLNELLQLYQSSRRIYLDIKRLHQHRRILR
jgi:hypothetical protein